MYKKTSCWTQEETRTLLPYILARDGRKCRNCGSKNKLTVHHIKPRAEGGTNHERNLITLCTECHDKVELGELVWEQYAFRAKEKEEKLDKKYKKKYGEKISMFRLGSDGNPIFIGYRYEL